MGITQGLLAEMVADDAPADLRGTAYGFFDLVTGMRCWSPAWPPACCGMDSERQLRSMLERAFTRSRLRVLARKPVGRA